MQTLATNDLIYPYTGSGYTYSEGIEGSITVPDSVGIWIIVASILAIIGGILVYFLFVKAKNNPKGKFLAWLKNFLAFKTMWIEPILKISYYIETIFVILFSFAFISQSFLTFLGILVFGPIITRLIYELFMMFIMVWRNTQDIADNTKKK